LLVLEVDDEAARCEVCGGRGWIVEGEGNAARARPCDCRRRQLAPRLLTAADIPERYRHCRVSNFQISHPDPAHAEQLVHARSVAERYVESFLDAESGRFRESGLLLIGPPGVGKTHLAAGILAEIIERYKARGLFVDFTSLLHHIQSTFDASNPESKHQVLDPVIGAEVLVLDELGAQKPTLWVTDILYLIINRRYSERRPTLFTSNFRLDDEEGDAPIDRAPSFAASSLSQRIPPTIVSRLREMAQPVVIEGDDFRVQKMYQHRL